MSLYNDREHTALFGAAPDDVEDSKVLQYVLEADAGKAVSHNNRRWRDKAGKLQDLKGFRVPLDRNTWDRIDQPKFSGKVHQVAGLKGANVEDEEGKSFPETRPCHRRIIATRCGLDVLKGGNVAHDFTRRGVALG